MIQLEALADLAIKAGAVILDIYSGDFAVATKADASPVTEADQRAEAVILEGLRRIAPGIPVIAEEESAAGRQAEIADRFILVDPLDGTREFVSRNGEFTVNIALVEGGAPVAGVVYAPALGRLYVGAKGEGAFAATVTGGVRSSFEPIAVRPRPAAGLTAIGSRSHGSPETATFLAPLPVAEFVSTGSSLKFCLVAEGKADLYPRHGRTMEWDTAAGDAVLRAAGGAVVTFDGRPLAYGKRRQAGDVDFANPYFLAVGDPDLVVVALSATA
ncbi:3'(2'),5'-bisphosphate nucleotidase CysQ [Chthonobacter rhizosphaerae]|uniref:3'(2'),5'-bisphosphate nucleotidase CysQ n=1 Tax=Chthonobacter rhizosphaerae TaxID=2735553 RepID=UPI0015EE783D|nr:3'(2'),5'-bisphosphate nucleotidase CysQ [Chthonobacter rhizosphaerae]